MQHQEVLAPGFVDTIIEVVVGPDVLRMPIVPDALIPESIYQLARVIVGAIIRDYDLDIGVCLVQRTLQTLTQVAICPVECGNANRDERISSHICEAMAKKRSASSVPINRARMLVARILPGHLVGQKRAYDWQAEKK